MSTLRERVPRKKVLVYFSLITVAILLFVALLMASYRDVYVVSGESMTPTFNNGDSIVIDSSENFTHDEIVVFTQQEQWPEYTEDRHGKLVIKRVVAVPGDTVSLRDNVLSVNGKSAYELPEDYECKTDSFTQKVPLDSLFVLGDNTDNSRDSLKALCLGASDPYVHENDVKDFGKAHVQKWQKILQVFRREING